MALRARARVVDAEQKLRLDLKGHVARVAPHTWSVIGKIAAAPHEHAWRPPVVVQGYMDHPLRWMVSMRSAREALGPRIEKLMSEVTKQRKMEARRKYEARGMGQVYAALRKPQPPGMTVIKRGEAYTAEPGEVEEELRRAWHTVFNPDEWQPQQDAREYFENHVGAVYHAAEFKVGPVTEARLNAAIWAAPPTAAGPDGFARLILSCSQKLLGSG